MSCIVSQAFLTYHYLLLTFIVLQTSLFVVLSLLA